MYVERLSHPNRIIFAAGELLAINILDNSGRVGDSAVEHWVNPAYEFKLIRELRFVDSIET